jgi:hypothetical protein
MSRSEEEATMQYAIAVHLGEKNIVIPNVSFARTSCRIPKYGEGEVTGYEYPFSGIRHKADLIWINDNDYLTEVEIKTSYSDFLADFKKKEKHLTKYTRAVYYAFPWDMYKENEEKIKKVLVEKFPEAGVIIIGMGGLAVSVIKNVEYFNAEKIPIEVKIGLMRIGCQKWWRRK